MNPNDRMIAPAGGAGLVVYCIDILRRIPMKFKAYSWLALFGLALGALSGCNTMEGVGEDVQGAGETIERGAEQNKPD